MAQYTSMFSPLPREFFEPSAEVVAKKLVGHLLIRKTSRGLCGGIIVETEAYLTGDPAAHSYRGETKRNRSMWGPAGHAYIYFIYGNHWCFNIVCRPPGIAEAVLIRAIEPTIGLELMQQLRPVHQLRNLTSGPGKLCAAMEITRQLEGVDLCDTNSSVFVAKNPELEKTKKQLGPLVTTTRIGIAQAVAVPMPYRFYLDGSEFVSRRRAPVPGALRHPNSLVGIPPHD